MWPETIDDPMFGVIRRLPSQSFYDSGNYRGTVKPWPELRAQISFTVPLFSPEKLAQTLELAHHLHPKIMEQIGTFKNLKVGRFTNQGTLKNWLESEDNLSEGGDYNELHIDFQLDFYPEPTAQPSVVSLSFYEWDSCGGIRCSYYLNKDLEVVGSYDIAF
jgi:hypothetical protein